MEQNFIRNIFYYKRYFLDFFDELTEDVQKKFNWTLELIETIDRVPKKYFQYLEEGIYEIRVEVGSNIFRIFCCFHKGNVIVLFNCFQKKTQKTPKGEIELAVKLMNEYFDNK